MKRGLLAISLTLFLLTINACSKQTLSNGSQNKGSINLSSEVAGMVLIDGTETGKRVKAQGSVIIENVETGMTEAAVLLDDGTVVKVAKTVLVKAGETVDVHILAPVIVQQETAIQITETEPVKQVETPALTIPTEPPKQETNTTPSASVPATQTPTVQPPVTPTAQAQTTTPTTSPSTPTPTATDDAVALFNSGTSYANKGDWDRAIVDYTAALRIKPDYFEALRNRGLAYVSKEDYDRAITDWTAALRIKPDDDLILQSRGLLYFAKQDYDSAIEDWETLLRINPNNTNARDFIQLARQMRGY